MDDRSKSFLTRIFECVNLGLECSAKQVRSRVPCPPRKRKTKSHTENDGSRDSDGTEKDTGIITVDKVEENMTDGEGYRKSSSPCPKPENQLLKEDICAEIASDPTCCFIKMIHAHFAAARHQCQQNHVHLKLIARNHESPPAGATFARTVW
ncbi:uncharacterized protein LOC112495293 [Cephus cinctus]|uniref:Uncharacterized protein LOC112495293 n=1 Tax=Cephus cinctus TaxID=211228 RepID=A0AAJ7W748_CEPCN|nr:uncharacterized protein LOC112495293 [Cephus cinctus]